MNKFLNWFLKHTLALGLMLLSAAPLAAIEAKFECADFSIEQFHKIQQFFIVESEFSPDSDPLSARRVDLTIKPGRWFQSKKDITFEPKFIKLRAVLSEGNRKQFSAPIELSREGANLKAEYWMSIDAPKALTFELTVETSQMSSITTVLPSLILRPK